MRITKTFNYEDIVGLKFGYAPFGKPSLYTHIYYVDGLLIDTGQRSMQKAVLQTTKDLPIDQMFITHHHEDHTGNIRAIQELYNCPVYASEACCELMKDPPSISLAQRWTWWDRPAYHKLQPISGAIKTNNYHFQLIPVPGHAPDMLALYEPDRKWLISADLYLNSYIGYFLPSESILQQIASIKKVLELDFKVMLCSHNPQFEEPKKQLQKKLQYLASFLEEVAKRHQKGLSAKAIFRELNFKENRFITTLSGGALSKLNMVRSAIRDLEHQPSA